MKAETMRTHTCEALRSSDIGQTVTLSGWIHRRRDHGGLIFIDLRDRYGLTQIVFDPTIDSSLHEMANAFRSEWPLTIQGEVVSRGEGMTNPKLATGEVEVRVTACTVHSKAQTPPFELDHNAEQTGEDIRLKYRYLDLRRHSLAHNFQVRHSVCLSFRKFLDSHRFLEITTPLLGKPTPEGSRDYIVPSRISPGNFYALPQSPQLYKQLLMVAGMDRYFQLAPCLRDEDLRSDRQPEFTQLDMEVSFMPQETFFNLIEEMLCQIFAEHGQSKSCEAPFPRLSYKECMDLYGTDKPDLRFDLKLHNLTDLVDQTDFSIFKEQAANGGIVKAICVPKGASFSRKDIDRYTALVGRLGIKGLAWTKINEEGSFQGGISKFLPEAVQKEISRRTAATSGDILFYVADDETLANQALDHLRRSLASDLSLIDPNKVCPLWVVDFPLFHWDKETQRLDSEHHPFTMPHPEDLHLLDKEETAKNMRSSSYDVVINGYEIGSGSQRIHCSEVQQKVFKLLQLSSEEVKEKFGFFVDALQFGTPPHRGIGLGLERLLMILLGTDNIRDVVAFPKTQKAADLMTQAPGLADPSHLEELKLRIDKR